MSLCTHLLWKKSDDGLKYVNQGFADDHICERVRSDFYNYQITLSYRIFSLYFIYL